MTSAIDGDPWPRRCWRPRSHDAHDWTDNTDRTVCHCDGQPFTRRAVSPDPSPVAPGDGSRPTETTPPTLATPDQQPAGAALPAALRDFLALPEVIIRPDEARCAVVICIPSYLARSLADLAPDPLQVRLAAQLVEAAEMDAADARLELLRTVAP